MSTRISVITICLNSESFIDKTINTVTAQNYDNLEYILIDGGSMDNTLPIIREYAEKDRRIRWVSEPDGGISDAMNKGISLATGDVIAHLHADDYYPHQNVISSVTAAFVANPDSIWLTGGAYLVDANGNLIREIRVRNCSYRNQLRVNRVIHPATFIRKSSFEKVGRFDTSLKYAMDYDLWLRLGRKADPVHLDQPIACSRMHSGSLSTAESKVAFAEEYQVRKKHLKGKLAGLFVSSLYYYAMKPFHQRFIANLLSRNRETAPKVK